MTTITTMDKAAAQTLGEAVQKALEAVAAEYGVTVKAGGGKYDPTAGTYSPKIEFRVEGGAEAEFRADAFLFGLTPDDYGREFTSRGRTFRIVGLNLRARRMPINAEEVATGRTYKFAAEGVKRALGQS